VEQFSISAGVREGFQILVVRGELDELTAPELDAAIDGHRDGRPVVVDLSETEFVSSAGLHALMRDRRESLAIVCPPGNVRRVLDIVQADLHLPLFSDLDTATQSLTLTYRQTDRASTVSQSRR
jgi:anti-anti-sigma factor